MKNKLTERLEIRLTPEMKRSAKEMQKSFDVSLAEVFRMGLAKLERREAKRK